LLKSRILREADFIITLSSVKGLAEKNSDVFPISWQTPAFLFAMASPAHFSSSIVNELPLGKFFEVTLYLYSKWVLDSCQG